jgi:hypothetical protein
MLHKLTFLKFLACTVIIPELTGETNKKTDVHLCTEYIPVLDAVKMKSFQIQKISIERWTDLFPKIT